MGDPGVFGEVGGGGHNSPGILVFLETPVLKSTRYNFIPEHKPDLLDEPSSPAPFQARSNVRNVTGTIKR